MSSLALALTGATAAGAAGRDRASTRARVASEEVSEWTLDSRSDGRLQMKLERRRDNGDDHSRTSWSFDAQPRDFRGLPDPDRSGDTPVEFRLVRDAGVFVFEGRMRRGHGSGTVAFEPDEDFRQLLSRSGRTRLADDDMERLAIHDVRRATVTSLRNYGDTPLTVDDLVRLAVHGASPEFIDDMVRSGYARLSVDDLVRLRVHGVSPALVHEYAELGYSRPSVDDLVRLRVHGAEPEFVRELKVLRRRPDVDELVRMRVHGVDAAQAREFIEMGYEDVTADDLVRFRVHGVSPEFARRALEKHPKLSAEELVRLRVNGRL